MWVNPFSIPTSSPKARHDRMASQVFRSVQELLPQLLLVLRGIIAMTAFSMMTMISITAINTVIAIMTTFTIIISPITTTIAIVFILTITTIITISTITTIVTIILLLFLLFLLLPLLRLRLFLLRVWGDGARLGANSQPRNLATLQNISKTLRSLKLKPSTRNPKP